MIKTFVMVIIVAIAGGCGELQARAGSNDDISSTSKTRGTDNVNHTCKTARSAIEARRFIGWHGLPSGCSPDALFGVALDERWGDAPLGKRFEHSRSRLLAIDGYYRPLAYVRDGAVAMFDGMNPVLDGGWATLSDDLGAPEARLDWVHATVDMPGGEWIYARRGITIFLNPENDFVIHVSVYVPTTVDGYVGRLRLNREKRPLPPR